MKKILLTIVFVSILFCNVFAKKVIFDGKTGWVNNDTFITTLSAKSCEEVKAKIKKKAQVDIISSIIEGGCEKNSNFEHCKRTLPFISFLTKISKAKLVEQKTVNCKMFFSISHKNLKDDLAKSIKEDFDFYLERKAGDVGYYIALKPVQVYAKAAKFAAKVGTLKKGSKVYIRDTFKAHFKNDNSAWATITYKENQYAYVVLENLKFISK